MCCDEPSNTSEAEPGFGLRISGLTETTPPVRFGVILHPMFTKAESGFGFREWSLVVEGHQHRCFMMDHWWGVGCGFWSWGFGV